MLNIQKKGEKKLWRNENLSQTKLKNLGGALLFLIDRSIFFLNFYRKNCISSDWSILDVLSTHVYALPGVDKKLTRGVTSSQIINKKFTGVEKMG